MYGAARHDGLALSSSLRGDPTYLQGGRMLCARRVRVQALRWALLSWARGVGAR